MTSVQYTPEPIDYASELAYGVAISVAYRIANQSINGDYDGAKRDYDQHCNELNTAAKAEFDRLIATAAANITAGAR